MMNNNRAAIPDRPYQASIEYEKQNAHLAHNKMTMYDNQRIQNLMGEELQQQGDMLEGGIDRNRVIRREAEESEGSIKLIEVAIMKRKLMFLSLLVLFSLALVVVVVVKLNRHG